MTLSTLDDMWSTLPNHPTTGGELKVIRFSKENGCRPELLLAIDHEGKRCILLCADIKNKNLPDSRENLSLDYIQDAHFKYVAIRLENAGFADLFDDLIVSIYADFCDRDPESPNLPGEFVQKFHKWSTFFDCRESAGMSFEALQGLMGELVYLGFLLSDTNPTAVNDILGSWVGPYHTRTDFELSDKRVEVKAISKAKKQVPISSEYQLEEEFGLGIELVVVYLEKDLEGGKSISEKIEDLRKVTYQLGGDFSIILTSLGKLGLSPGNFGDYDNTRFTHLETDTYNAAQSGFPKLVRSALPGSIKSVKYTLKLHELADYLVPDDPPK